MNSCAYCWATDVFYYQLFFLSIQNYLKNEFSNNGTRQIKTWWCLVDSWWKTWQPAKAWLSTKERKTPNYCNKRSDMLRHAVQVGIGMSVRHDPANKEQKCDMLEIMMRDWRTHHVERVTTPRTLFSQRFDFSKSLQVPVILGGPPREGGHMTWLCVATAEAVAEQECRILRFTQNKQLGSAVLIVLFSTVITKVSVTSTEKRQKTINLCWWRAELTLWVLTVWKGEEIKPWIGFPYQGFDFLFILVCVVCGLIRATSIADFQLLTDQ